MRTILTAMAVSLAAAGAAHAEWPEKPIKVVVPFNPGGTSDQVSRAFTTAIQENDILPQPLNVINVGGGHFSIGARQVLDAEPDGYTFLTLHIALMGAEAGGMLDFSYRDFVPVATTGEFCLVPMVRKDSGIDSIEQLLAKAKDEPDTLVFGVNLGAINHLAGVMLQNLEDGASFRFAQVGGGTANYTALTGAQTDVAVLSAAEVANFTMGPDGQPLEDAQIKPLGYTGTERVGPLPDLPTLQRARLRHELLRRELVVRAQGYPAGGHRQHGGCARGRDGDRARADLHGGEDVRPRLSRGRRDAGLTRRDMGAHRADCPAGSAELGRHCGARGAHS